MDAEALKSCSIDELDEAICQAHALMASAAHQSMLELVGEFDRRRAWEPNGAHSVSGWLSFGLGMSGATASNWAKVARALGSLLAGAPGGYTDTTSGTGARTVPPTGTTWCFCAGIITGWSTRAGGGSGATPTSAFSLSIERVG